jgi:hypothetical protein
VAINVWVSISMGTSGLGRVAVPSYRVAAPILAGRSQPGLAAAAVFDVVVEADRAAAAGEGLVDLTSVCPAAGAVGDGGAPVAACAAVGDGGAGIPAVQNGAAPAAATAASHDKPVRTVRGGADAGGPVAAPGGVAVLVRAGCAAGAAAAHTAGPDIAAGPADLDVELLACGDRHGLGHDPALTARRVRILNTQPQWALITPRSPGGSSPLFPLCGSWRAPPGFCLANAD